MNRLKKALAFGAVPHMSGETTTELGRCDHHTPNPIPPAAITPAMASGAIQLLRRAAGSGAPRPLPGSTSGDESLRGPFEGGVASSLAARLLAGISRAVWMAGAMRAASRAGALEAKALLAS